VQGGAAGPQPNPFDPATVAAQERPNNPQAPFIKIENGQMTSGVAALHADPVVAIPDAAGVVGPAQPQKVVGAPNLRAAAEGAAAQASPRQVRTAVQQIGSALNQITALHGETQARLRQRMDEARTRLLTMMEHFRA
jgi:hypothetical protein